MDRLLPLSETMLFGSQPFIADMTAKMMLEVKAVHFSQDKPFVFTSGWASPVYIDVRKLISYPRVRLGNDNMGLCKLPWVDVFNPESATRTDTDIHINPASQENYAEYFNAMLGTDLTWEEIFARTDRDINLQRVMNVLRFGRQTASHDWIPDRAIGPTDDALYEAEALYNDAEVARITGRPPAEVAGLPTAEKRTTLMACRKEELSKLIKVYYAERGWNGEGVPFVDTLQELDLWPLLSPEEQRVITELTAG